MVGGTWFSGKWENQNHARNADLFCGQFQNVTFVDTKRITGMAFINLMKPFPVKGRIETNLAKIF